MLPETQIGIISCQYDERFYYNRIEIEVPNKNGTPVHYEFRINHVDFDEQKDKFINIVVNAIKNVIHPVVTKCYDLTERHEPLSFYQELKVAPNWNEWSLSQITLKTPHDIVYLELTQSNATLRYTVYDYIQKPTFLKFEVQNVDGSLIRIEVDTRLRVDDKSHIAYKYVKTVENTPTAILDGIEDVLLLHQIQKLK